ncbi:MAG: FHA domain-containing protein [Candidatus Methylacidiphilales bacterium]|nr:FHA domain-containing protein [Candidatus Methylacidiphilales bacterium]
MPKLIVKSPEFAGVVFDLNKPSVTIGRGEEDNTYALAHPSVSTRHAEFRLESGDYRLIDLGSTNGTRVNDERITETVLRNQDVVMLGNMLMTYESETSAAAAPMPVAETRVSLPIGAQTGRPANFKNLAPFPKPRKSAGGFPMLVLVAFLVALGGAGFLIFKFLSL